MIRRRIPICFIRAYIRSAMTSYIGGLFVEQFVTRYSGPLHRNLKGQRERFCAPNRSSYDMLNVVGPVIFVLMWSTGLVVARAIVSHASLGTFLFVRMMLSAGLLGGIALLMKEKWPSPKQLLLHLSAGALLHGVYLCAAYWTVARGMPAGIMSLMGSMQPLVTAAALFFIDREVPPTRTLAGLATAFAGVVCVLAPALSNNGYGHIGVSNIVAAITAVIGMTAGTIIQRGRLSSDGVRVSGSIQNAGGAMVALVGMFFGSFGRWDNLPIVWFSLIWSVVGLSVGAVLLLIWMVRSQGAAKMSTLLLAVPALAAAEAWFIFGEKLTFVQIIGFVLAVSGVVVARGKAKALPQQRVQVKKLGNA